MPRGARDPNDRGMRGLIPLLVWAQVGSRGLGRGILLPGGLGHVLRDMGVDLIAVSVLLGLDGAALTLSFWARASEGARGFSIRGSSAAESRTSH